MTLLGSQAAALAPGHFWAGEILEEQKCNSLDVLAVHPRLVALGCILSRRPEAVTTRGPVQPVLLRDTVLCSKNGIAEPLGACSSQARGSNHS